MKEHFFSDSQWKWTEIDFLTEEAELKKLSSYYLVPNKWVKEAAHNVHNNLQMNQNINERKAIWGSLIYQLKADDEDSQKIFHFFLSENILVTGNLDFLNTEGLNKEVVLQNMSAADTAVEGMMAIISAAIENILSQIDMMEADIRDLLWQLRKSNGQKVLEQLLNLRHQLLILKNLIIPIQEIYMVVKEVFNEKEQDSVLFKKVANQLDRCHYLISEYTQEVSTMVDVEDITASVMGNEVMKTLTVITLLFSPISAWGAWWGMNFVYMPELNWEYGYLFAAIFILINTVILYGFLKRKGWLGDLLKKKNKQ